MVEPVVQESQKESSEEKFILRVVNKTLTALGEPTCETLEEGHARISEMIKRGVFSRELLEEIVDQAIDSVQDMSQYKMIFSDSNSSSIRIPRNGILKLASEKSFGNYFPVSDRPQPYALNDLLSGD